MRDLETLYRSLYLYIILNWTVVEPLRLYIKAQPVSGSSGGK